VKSSYFIAPSRDSLSRVYFCFLHRLDFQSFGSILVETISPLNPYPIESISARECDQAGTDIRASTRSPFSENSGGTQQLTKHRQALTPLMIRTKLSRSRMAKKPVRAIQAPPS
jgi:hypothetical protein